MQMNMQINDIKDDNKYWICSSRISGSYLYFVFGKGSQKMKIEVRFLFLLFRKKPNQKYPVKGNQTDLNFSSYPF